jgi:predicted phage tail protein
MKKRGTRRPRIKEQEQKKQADETNQKIKIIKKRKNPLVGGVGVVRAVVVVVNSAGVVVVEGSGGGEVVVVAVGASIVVCGVAV